MIVNDPIADMLTRIRNALIARHEEVSIPYSRMKAEIARILLEEGYLDSVDVEQGTPASWLHLKVRYVGERRQRRPVISGLKRVSKPGRRIYAGYRDIPWVMSGMGIAILTTPQGVLTDQQARRQKVGGEVLAYVW